MLSVLSAPMRRYILPMLAILAVPPAYGQIPCRGPEGLPQPASDGGGEVIPFQFHRVAGRLACALPNQDGVAMAQGERPITFLPCLKVGAVAIGDGLRQVEDLLGEPTHVNTLDWRTEARVYPIAQRSIPEPYYVVTYRNDVAVAVQLIGPPTEMPATLSGLSLGDSEQNVLDHLGRPERLCSLQNPGPLTWMWTDFPIGVDVLDGRVVGLKATWPEGRPTPE